MLARRTLAIAVLGIAVLGGIYYFTLGAKYRLESTEFFQQEEVIAGSPKDSLEVRHLVLKGSNKEIGRTLARLANERYQAQPQASQDPLRTRNQRQYIEKAFPILHARMQGAASFFGHPLEDDAWDQSSLAFTELRAGCSVVHLPPRSTTTGKGIVSRDYDYSTGSMNFGFLAPGMLHATARPYLVELHPDRGYASLAMVSYDLLSGVLDGINSEGLTVALAMDDELFNNYPIEPTLGSAVGLGELQALRLLLDTCATVEEAKAALLQTKQYYAFIPVHYLIADRFGKSFVWEYSHAHNKEFIIENPNHPLVMTNFSLNRHLDKNRPPSVDQAKNICRRYCLLTEQLAAAPGKLSNELIKLTHKKVDAESAASLDKSRPPVRTFWHALYFPEERRVQISYYLRDEPVADQSNRVKVVRSDYQEFRLSPTNSGKPPQESNVDPKPEVSSPAPKSEGVQQTVLAEFTKRGAILKTEGDRVVSADLDKVQDLKPLLPLLHKLPDLAELTIRNSAMDDAGMVLLEGLPKLARLHLLSSNVGDEGLKVLKTLPSLRFLPLGRTKVTDAGLVHLATLTKLEYLGVRGNAITDAGLNHLEKLTNLNTLDLTQTKVTDAGLAHLKGMARLEVLFLQGDNISDAGLAQLENLTTIGGLFLAETRITDAGLVHLQGMRRLTKLNVAKTAVTEEGIAKARKFLPSWITIQKEQP